MPKSKLNVTSTEKFVEVVRTHPILYDPTCPAHKDAQRVYNIWESIAKVMKLDKMDGKYHIHTLGYTHLGQTTSTQCTMPRVQACTPVYTCTYNSSKLGF